MEQHISLLVEALLASNRLAAESIVSGLQEQTSSIRIIEAVVVPALECIGKGWEEGSVALSQIYMGGRICERMVDRLLPPGAPDRKNQPCMAVCVLHDHHMLGKQIVYSLLRAGGFELADYGSLSVEALVGRVRADDIKVLLISVLMLPSALKVKTLRRELDRKGVDVKIVVGGAPFKFDSQLWKKVGADAMCTTASDVLPLLEQIGGGIFS